MKIDRIYVDLDGVLADFVGGVLHLFHQPNVKWPPGEYYIWKVLGLKNESEMWTEIDRLGADFWASLDPYPWRDELFDLCASLAATGILSSPSQDPASAMGKLEWLQEWKGREFRDFALSPAKDLFAHPQALLIDDSDKNCAAFRKAGGQAILFPQKWNKDYVDADIAMEIVKRALRRLV